MGRHKQTTIFIGQELVIMWIDNFVILCLGLTQRVDFLMYGSDYIEAWFNIRRELNASLGRDTEV